MLFSPMKCRVYVSDEDIAHWNENAVTPLLKIDSMRDVVRIFINGELIGNLRCFHFMFMYPYNLLVCIYLFWNCKSCRYQLMETYPWCVTFIIYIQNIGSAKGNWVQVVQQVQFKQGYNDVMLLSQTVGLQVLKNHTICLVKFGDRVHINMYYLRLKRVVWLTWSLSNFLNE